MIKDLAFYSQDTPPREYSDNYLNLIQPNISGGRIARADIDSIAKYSQAREITISGLTQETFEYFVEKYAAQFEVIIFWKCPLIVDLQAIESLGNVKYLIFFWNQRAVKLWDFSKTRALVGLSFDDFTRLHDISDIAGSNLEELHFGDKIWDQMILNSLAPLQECQNLRRISFSAKKIVDGKIAPLASLTLLRSLEFPLRLFSTEDVAWLKAHLPVSVESKMMNPYWQIESPIEMNGKQKNTFVVGKGKPFLDAIKDKKRLDKYVDSFQRMYEWFLAHPAANPEDYSG